MATTPYDSVIVALNAAKARLNDRIETLLPTSGKLLDLAQPHAQEICSLAFRQLQEELATMKYSGLEQETNLTSIPACVSTDPLVQVRIGFDGYFDGSTLQAAPVLPQNLIRPYKLFERVSGSSAVMTDMDEILNGLPSVPKMTWNRQWEWRDDILYMPGSTAVTDIRMRYAVYFSDFVDNSPTASTAWYAQPIPIMRCVDAFADYICCQVEIARQNPDAAAMFQASAELKAKKLAGRDVTQAQATPSTAQLNKMRDKYVAVQGVPKTEKR